MADSKLTALTENTAPTTDDLLYLVDAPGGTPASRKVTLANLLNSTAITSINLFGSATTLNLGAAAVNINLTAGAMVFNESGADIDFRFEGDTEPNLLVLDAGTGFVGIGTTAPTHKLDVGGVAGPTIGLISSSDSFYATVLQNQYSTVNPFNLTVLGGNVLSVTEGGATVNINAALHVGSPATRGIALQTEGATKMWVDSSGNVGIGTTAPGTKLEIADDGTGLKIGRAGNDLRLFDDGVLGNSYVGTESASKLVFRTNAANRITVDTSGNVGIGTVSPDRLLHPELADAVTNVVSYPFRLTHITSGTPANSIGVGIEFEQETSADNNEVIATIEAVVTDVTATSEDAALVFKTMVAGAAATEGMRIVGSVVSITGTISATGARVTQSYHTNITSTNAVVVDSSILSKVPESIVDYAGDALAVIAAMRVVGYRHYDYLDASNRVKLGVIAETVSEPLALQEIENPSGGTYPGVNLMGLTALNSRGIQQLQERISRLERALLAAGIEPERMQ